ncbi:hypothetical protein [uncultured Psychrosphaera sp.]|uniref:hypothetical protein n=1 Tax=uncultured Psychrosphaera sp. TaxID=1403522 RepID=UPI00262D95D9|nr:hypothetical protein [uncultured Psychrosphaera sp.]
MRGWLNSIIFVLSACDDNTENKDNEISQTLMDWQPISELQLLNGYTESLSLSTSEDRQTLRVTSNSDTASCFQVNSAISQYNQELSYSFNTAQCVDCLWRTSVIRNSGLLVLEGNAEQLAAISFASVDCTTYLSNVSSDELVVEKLETELPALAGLKLRFNLSDSVVNDLDENDWATLISNELNLSILITSMNTISDVDVVLENSLSNDELESIIATLPDKDEGVIDIIYGPCLEIDTYFSIERLAGFTPSIPGGAGDMDAVFVARRTCGSRNTETDEPATVARLIAHELGHYLGLAHPEEANGTLDDLDSTTTSNLMHRNPLLVSSTGLTDEQVERIMQHPFFQDLSE